ncbi:hypothetical protein Tco_0381637 [Tanacetum coccineum]
MSVCLRTMDKTQELKRITMLQEMRDDDRKATRKKQEAMSQQALQEAKEAKAARHKEALEAVRAETKKRNEESVLNKVQVPDIVMEFVVKVTDVGFDQAVVKMVAKKVGETASAVKESVAEGLKQAFGGKDDN